jgi:tRNA-modifying protein YgfZ
MKAALLPDRGVVKVSGDPAREFLNGLLTADVGRVAPGRAVFAALLTPQGKIVVDCIVAEAAAEDGGGFLLDCPRGLATTLVGKLNIYKLRAKVLVEDRSETLGVLAAWDGASASDASTDCGVGYADPRFAALGSRVIIPPALAPEAAADLGAELVDAQDYEAYRIALGIPRGGLDFLYNDAFPHEADMDQLNGVDFAKGCYVGQEVVSRMQHRGTARTRVVPVAYGDFAPEAGVPVTAAEKPIGVMGSAAGGRGLAALRLDRVAEAQAAGHKLLAGGIEIRPVKPEWARFAFPGDSKAVAGDSKAVAGDSKAVAGDAKAAE